MPIGETARLSLSQLIDGVGTHESWPEHHEGEEQAAKRDSGERERPSTGAPEGANQLLVSGAYNHLISP
jgi:hypothetical protein